VLIQQILGAIVPKFVAETFGLGTAKSQAVGFGLLGRLLSLMTLLEALQVDDVAHARTPSSSGAKTQQRITEMSVVAPRARKVDAHPESP
jgi:hypothetical protein